LRVPERGTQSTSLRLPKNALSVTLCALSPALRKCDRRFVHLRVNSEHELGDQTMIRSTNQEMGEYDLIREPDHVARVWKEIESALPAYWERFVASETKAAKEAKKRKSSPKDMSEAAVVTRVFDEAVASFEKTAAEYRKYFSPAAFETYHDDPSTFTKTLSRDVPVIANTLRQRHAELREWQMHFRRAKANDLLQVFANVFDFIADWLKDHPVTSYALIDDADGFGLDPLDSDETMSMVNVIGMGIKSVVLHHIDPERLPRRGQLALYGLYFLSGKKDFDLPTKSSEFLMINDVNPVADCIIMDQNYWYPYGLFSLYALRIYRWIEGRAATACFTLDKSVRYVYVDRFLDAVCNEHIEDRKTMRAHERFEVPG
jgi:hypothetical protein